MIKCRDAIAFKKSMPNFLSMYICTYLYVCIEKKVIFE